MKIHWGVRDRDTQGSQGAEAFDVGRDNRQVETDWQGETQEGTRAGNAGSWGVLEVGLLLWNPNVSRVVGLELGPWWKERFQINLRITFLHRGGRALLHSKGSSRKSRRASWEPYLENTFLPFPLPPVCFMDLFIFMQFDWCWCHCQ